MCNYVGYYDFEGFRINSGGLLENPLDILERYSCYITSDVKGNTVLYCITTINYPSDMFFCGTFMNADKNCIKGENLYQYCGRCISRNCMMCPSYLYKDISNVFPDLSLTVNLKINPVFPPNVPICPSGSIPDRNGNCTLIECGAGYILNNGICQVNIEYPALVGDPIKQKFFRSNSSSIFQKCLQESVVELVMFAFVHISRDESFDNKTMTVFLAKLAHHWSVSHRTKTFIVYKSIDLTKNVSINNILSLAAKISNVNISKIVISSGTPLQTFLYGFDLTRTFKGSKLCSSIIPISDFTNDSSHNKNSTCSTLIGDKLNTTINVVHNINMDKLKFNIVMENGVIGQSAYYCQQFHLSSDCFRESLYPKNFDIDNNKTLRFKTSRETLILKADEFFSNI